MLRTPIEYCQPAFSSSSKTFVFQKPESARSSLTPVAPARSTRAISSSQKRLIPILRVRRALAQPDVQRLTGVGARGQQRVIPEDARVAVAGALLLVAADLADEAVDVDHQPPGAGTRPGLPGARQRLGQQLVELAHMPERERAQKRPSVDGAGSQPPNRRRVRPARSTSASSMLSAPSTIANTSAITLRPALAAPGRSRRSRTSRPASASTPSRPASVATNAIPASLTTRSSSNSTCRPSSPTAVSSSTTKVTS